MTEENLPLGTITDEHIKYLAESGLLINENFLDKQIKQACYELRASNICRYPLESDTPSIVPDNGYILVKPKQLIIVITLENILLPDNIMARILTKGKLFSVGLSAVNTYADPGFEGRLGIVLYNLSNNYLKIYPNTSIAKIEFSKLATPVKNIYKGQHGYQTEIWPIPKEMIATEDDLKNDNRIHNTIEEIALSYGGDMGRLIKRVFTFERNMLLVSGGYFFLTFTLLAVLSWKNSSDGSWSTYLSLAGLGIISSLIASLIVYYATVVRKNK